MTADALVSGLDGVRRTGHSTWLARCPAHDDGKASLSIREMDDGRTLVHCFAGCSVHEVVAAVGLEMDALFPPRTNDHRQRGEKRPFPALDVLQAVEFEVLLAALAAGTLGNGGSLTEEDRERLLLASIRLTQAVEIANGTR